MCIFLINRKQLRTNSLFMDKVLLIPSADIKRALNRMFNS